MLDGAAPTRKAFDALAEDDEFVVFVEPPSLDDRIINQAALFSLMPSPHAQLEDRLERHPDLARVLVLPAELKWEIRDKLSQSNVTERVLFLPVSTASRAGSPATTPRAPGPPSHPETVEHRLIAPPARPSLDLELQEDATGEQVLDLGSRPHADLLDHRATLSDEDLLL